MGLRSKEIENFLLVPAAIDRAAARRVLDQVKRGGATAQYNSNSASILDEYAQGRKNFVMAQYLDSQQRFERSNSPRLSQATVNQAALEEFEKRWQEDGARFAMISGKDAIGFLNQKLQNEYGVSVTTTAIIDAMKVGEIEEEMQCLIGKLTVFAKSKEYANIA
jgi:hypothetical protein